MAKQDTKAMTVRGGTDPSERERGNMRTTIGEEERAVYFNGIDKATRGKKRHGTDKFEQA